MKFFTSFYFLLLLTTSAPLSLRAQDGVDSLQYPMHSLPDVVYKERGFNITALAAQFVPLGKAIPNAGPIAYQSQRIKNRRLLRFALGASFDADFENVSANIRFGFGREIPFHNNWTYYQGTDIWLFLGNVNVPIIPRFDEPFPGFGIAPFIGIRYHITPNFNLSTETHLFAGVAIEHAVSFQIIPPVSLILSARIPRKLLHNSHTHPKSN